MFAMYTKNEAKEMFSAGNVLDEFSLGDMDNPFVVHDEVAGYFHWVKSVQLAEHKVNQIVELREARARAIALDTPS